MTKREIKSLFNLIFVGIPILVLVLFINAVGWETIIFFIFAVMLLYFLIKVAYNWRRQAFLMDKYGDKELVKAIMNRMIWQGQTAEQLTDSLGQPHNTDQKVLKTKKKEVWKYHHQGGNRYDLRITLDNDEVIGWDQKS